MRWSRQAGWIFIAGILSAMSGGSVFAQAGASVAEQYLFAAANAERSERGLPLLRWDASLCAAAEMHDREMAARESISHQYAGERELSDRGRASGVRFSVIAENVAEAATAVRIHDAWMHSAGHRANLLDPKVDAVGIRVLRRNGQLYAVEDFAKIVANVSVAEQERLVGALIARASAGGAESVALLRTNEEARQSCSMERGYVGERQPAFVMRYTTPNLDVLPSALTKSLASGGYREAMVGACEPRGAGNFSTYSLAVLLYR
jgi:hypothetical protein